jgi:hypothetical protein
LKSEIRGPKPERNPNPEIRKQAVPEWDSPFTHGLQPPNGSDFGLRISGFFRASGFGFRISKNALGSRKWFDAWRAPARCRIKQRATDVEGTCPCTCTLTVTGLQTNTPTWTDSGNPQ